VCTYCTVVGGGVEHARNVKVRGIRATLGLRSGSAALEKISYSGGTGNRLRLHLTIDQSFKDRLAQAKKGGSGQWSPISLAPCLPGVTTASHSNNWDAGNNDDIGCADLTSLLQDVAAGPLQSDDGGLTMTKAPPRGVHVDSGMTPADLSDLSAVDLLQLPADWALQLSDDFDVNADFTALTDDTINSSLPLPAVSTASFLPQISNHQDHHHQSRFLAAQPAAMSSEWEWESFPVYDDDVMSSGAYPTLGDMLFDVANDDFWWNASSIGAHHAISVQ